MMTVLLGVARFAARNDAAPLPSALAQTALAHVHACQAGGRWRDRPARLPAARAGGHDAPVGLICRCPIGTIE